VLSEEIPASPDDVRSFYTDLHNITAIHPLVVAVHATQRTEIVDGYQQSYRVQDRIPLGPFTLPTSYQVRLTVPAEGDVLTEARQFPGVVLNGVVSFEAIDAGTRITERIAIEAPRPLAAITTGEATKAHAEMLAGIRRHFGG
jgi:hypothetical protein